jgi:glycosyltransferase involved in cell wall biosynthesis
LIKALEYLIKNTQKRIDMGQNGIKRVEMLYDRNAIWDELLNEYNKMVKEVEI